MPTFNGEKYIKEQLVSILDQISMDDEIIISDDCSTDNTLSIVAELNDNRIKVFSNDKNLHYIKNVENTLKHANGDFIFLADQDDVWVSNKVASVMEGLRDSDLIVSDCYVTDSTLNTIHTSYFKLRKTKKNKVLGLVLGSPYLGCCMAFKRNVLLKSLPFPEYISSHDTWLGNVGAFLFKAKFIDEKLIYYRRHGSNASILAGTSTNPYWLRFWKRFQILRGLLAVR